MKNIFKFLIYTTFIALTFFAVFIIAPKQIAQANCTVTCCGQSVPNTCPNGCFCNGCGAACVQPTPGPTSPPPTPPPNAPTGAVGCPPANGLPQSNPHTICSGTGGGANITEACVSQGGCGENQCTSNAQCASQSCP